MKKKKKKKKKKLDFQLTQDFFNEIYNLQIRIFSN